MKYSEIDQRMNDLVKQPIKPIPEKVMNEIIDEIQKKTSKSKRMFDDAKKVIPGGVEHMLSPTTPYPIFIDRGERCYLFDVDENRYLDYLNGAGPVLLGHNPASILEKIQEMMKKKGWFHGLPDEYETLAAQKIIQHMPSVERVRFFQSGTEAVMAAIRLARAFTGKKKIIKFAGSYHGWSDQLVLDLWVPYSGRFLASGIPESVTENTIIVPQNDPDALITAIKDSESDGGIAAVLLEPVGAESGTIPINESFIGELRKITQENGIILIFDEVVTGFRVSMGGAQNYFNVNADLTVFGKAIAGGFPSCGAVGGKAELMDIMKSGIMSGGGPSCFVAGTLAANPLTCAAIYYTISEIERTNAVDKATKTTSLLVEKLNELFNERQSKFFAYNYGSILHIETTALLYIDVRKENGITQILERKNIINTYQTFLINEGVMTLMGKGFVTCVHGDGDISFTVEAFKKLLEKI